jgi:hypothetical protein
MSFKKNKYLIIKKVVSKELINFIYDYFILKREAVRFMYTNNIVQEHALLGTWNDPQVPNVYSHYSDFVMETLLTKVMPIMLKKTKLKLIPTYSYARIYENGSILERHKDRSSCEISTTLNLGGDLWPIFIKKDNKEIKINLMPGDMLVYFGCELEHWREKFTGKICAQVFLHYNHKKRKFGNSNLYDKRPLLGLPSFIKNNE